MSEDGVRLMKQIAKMVGITAPIRSISLHMHIEQPHPTMTVDVVVREASEMADAIADCPINIKVIRRGEYRD